MFDSQSAANLEVCAALCILIKDTCNMFVYNADQTCYLGQFSKMDGNLIENAVEENLYVRTSKLNQPLFRKKYQKYQ